MNLLWYQMNKLENFIKRNFYRNKNLYHSDKIENIDYILCPVSGARLKYIKKNYVEKTLGMSFSNFISKFPNQILCSESRKKSISMGLSKIDELPEYEKLKNSQLQASENTQNIDQEGDKEIY